MNNMYLLLALMGGGGSVSPQFITALQDAQKDSFERWSKLLKALGLIITTGIFYLRGISDTLFKQGSLPRKVESSRFTSTTLISTGRSENEE